MKVKKCIHGMAVHQHDGRFQALNDPQEFREVRSSARHKFWSDRNLVPDARSVRGFDVSGKVFGEFDHALVLAGR